MSKLPTEKSVMPPRMDMGSHRHTSMGALITNWRETEARDTASGFWGSNPDWLLGTIVPPFQRPLVWDKDRMIAFIRSAWVGVHLGTYVVNDLSADRHLDDDRGADGKVRFHPADRWLIDGQQRLHAIQQYVTDAFPVCGYHWSELGARDQRRFEMIPFESKVLVVPDEFRLRELYDLMNFGGVAHEEAHRATPRR